MRIPEKDAASDPVRLAVTRLREARQSDAQDWDRLELLLERTAARLSEGRGLDAIAAALEAEDLEYALLGDCECSGGLVEHICQVGGVWVEHVHTAYSAWKAHN